MQETQSSDNMSTSLLRLAALSRQYPQRCFTNLNQYLTKDLLRAAFHQTRKDGAAGVDGQTAEDYAQNLEDNLESLLDRVKSGCYHAPPVRRCYIPGLGSGLAFCLLVVKVQNFLEVVSGVARMARPLRLEFSGALYHVTSRGNRRENIFDDDDDRRQFLQCYRMFATGITGFTMPIA